jgi:hypothetical protein
MRLAVAIVALATGAVIACADKDPTGTHRSAAWVRPDGLTRDTLRDANGTFPLTAAAAAMLALPFDTLNGSKHAVVQTPGGVKALYAEESSEAWFSDYGFGRLRGGCVRVLLDRAFAETVNPSEPYHVFVQPYGRAELYVTDRTPESFTVAARGGALDAEFSYRVVAKRLRFEGTRLEPVPWADQVDPL